MDNTQKIAQALLSIKAVFLSPQNPFTWASGIKSPIYCDNRLTLSYPEVRTLIDESIAQVIKEYYPSCEIVMGTSTAGIAHAAIAADRLNLPAGYVRGSAKDHGRCNQIEGRVYPGCKVVVVEDLISTAGSVLDCVQVLREAQCEVSGVVSIFTYGMQKGIERLHSANVSNISLLTFDDLLPIAQKLNYIEPADVTRLLAFRDNPQDSSWMDL